MPERQPSLLADATAMTRVQRFLLALDFAGGVTGVVSQPYLRRELSRRMRQAAITALGLALGTGLVTTVTAAASGVRAAQAPWCTPFTGSAPTSP